MKKELGIVFGLVILQAVVLFVFGQPSICECGYIKVWEGVVLSSGNSQHLTDWYTFSHIIHGFAFYFLLKWFFPRLTFSQRLVIAVGLEAGWEILENTPMVIDHYRQQALAQGYIGDSILNSVSDTLAMLFGFILSKKLSAKYIIIIAVVLELFTLIYIRDNLTLNIINLIYTSPTIAEWQAGGN